MSTTLQNTSFSLAETHELEESNKAAWDRLYASTDDLVWGNRPLPFVEQSIRKLRALDQLPETPRILDAATGEGRNLPTLLQTSPTVTACDASPAALAKLGARFGEAVSPVECDLAAMPFASYYFDLVLACDIIETLPNLEQVLSEIARILRPGGVLIANVPDFDDGISSENMEQLPSGEFLYQGNYFFRFQKESEFVAIMNRCGFDLISSESETWWEDAHPGYRHGIHSHTSRIILAVHKMD